MIRPISSREMVSHGAAVQFCGAGGLVGEDALSGVVIVKCNTETMDLGIRLMQTSVNGAGQKTLSGAMDRASKNSQGCGNPAGAG